MRLRNCFSVTLALMATTGCSSLNVGPITIQQYYLSSTEVSELAITPAPAPPEPSKQAAAPAKPSPKAEVTTPAPQPEQKHNLCPPFQLPVLPAIPPLPLKEIEQIGPTDTSKLSAIERKHIEDLRTHALQVRSLIVNAHAQYMVGCRIYARK